MIADLCIMVRVFTWHSPGLPMVLCCNGGEREREVQRETKPVAAERSGGTSMAVPGRGMAQGQLGIGREVGLLSPVDLEPRPKATLQVKMWQFVFAKQETLSRAAGTEGMSSGQRLWHGGTPKMC